MFGGTNNYSLSDIAAVSRGNDDGFGGGNGWWIIILVLLLCGAWGNGYGWGGNGGGNSGPYGSGIGFSLGVPATQADVFNQTLISKLDGQTYGLADSTYALNNAITNGFAAAQLERANNALTAAQNTFTIQNAIQADTIANAQNTNAIQSQLANCCCDNRAAVKDLQYAMATQANATDNLVSTNFGNLRYDIAAQDCQTRQTVKDSTQAIIARIDALEVNRKDEKIAEQAQQISALQLAASQAAQNNYLISQLKPCPVPSFPASNLYGYYNNCGCNCANA